MTTTPCPFCYHPRTVTGLQVEACTGERTKGKPCRAEQIEVVHLISRAEWGIDEGVSIEGHSEVNGLDGDGKSKAFNEGNI